MKKFLLILFLCIFHSLAAQNLENVEERVKDLISKMTIEEKISQLNAVLPNEIPRLSIPRYVWFNEALHGLVDKGVTVFPQSIAIAATFDISLMYKIATAISDEGRIKFKQNKMGLNYWSPNINIFRDPRWCRGQETYGEDPYLTSRMAVAFVKGIQGEDKHYLKAIASPKHFAVHSGPEQV